VYDQDGILFDIHGNEIVEHESPEPNIPDPPVSEPVEKPPDDEAVVMGLLKDGKTRAAIRRITGLHHKTIERIVKNASVATEG
jgi:hypothetical protein